MEQPDKNIPLDELRERKINLERNISTMITSFSKDYGVQIEKIDVSVIPYQPEKSEPWSAVDINIRLGL